jgi:4'-phosphopantetheinyl transferase
MPLVQHTNLNENTILALWKIEETKEQLFLMLREVKDNGINLHTSIHWLASRVLLGQLYEGKTIELHKDEFNKPSLIVNGDLWHISISHSHEYAVVIVSAKDTVAVDIEKVDARVIRVAHKFIREDEQVADEAVQTLMYTIIWSAKETLYKYYSKKELDFKQNLRIELFEPVLHPFMIKGHIEKGDYRMALDMHVTTLGDYMLTYIV